VACTTTDEISAVKPITAEVITKTSMSWDGSILPAYPQAQPEITILRIIIQPGASIDWHKHPMINAGVLLKGQLTVESEEQDVLHLNAGDPIVELVNKWHHGVNNGLEPVEIIVFYAGAEGLPLSVHRP